LRIGPGAHPHWGDRLRATQAACPDKTGVPWRGNIREISISRMHQGVFPAHERLAPV